MVIDFNSRQTKLLNQNAIKVKKIDNKAFPMYGTTVKQKHFKVLLTV